MSRIARVACIAALALVPPGLRAQAEVAPQPPAPAHDTFTIASRALHEPRLINVHMPPGHSAQGQRLPVLYMPDGGLDEDFAHVVHTVDSLIDLRVIRPVMVAGIPNTQRRRDLTGATRIATDSAIAPRVGGSAAFRQFIREELIPAIDARYRTTGERSIVGESLAGLFIVETLLTEPRLFKHYVALDPSLWWNAGSLVDSAASRRSALPMAVRDSVHRSLYLASSVDDVGARTAQLAALLTNVPESRLVWRYAPRPDLTHGTIFLGVGPAALAFALR